MPKSNRKVLLGPVLYVGNSTDTKWRFNLQLLVEGDSSTPPPFDLVLGNPPKSVGFPSVAADLTEAHECVYWRWQVEVDRGSQEKWIQYRIRRTDTGTTPAQDVVIDDVAVPASGTLPRFAFFSCNGVSSEKLLRRVGDLNILWRQMLAAHCRVRQQPSRDLPGGYHLLLGGGDSIYADSLWAKIPELIDIMQQPVEERVKRKPPKDFDTRLLRAYVKLYIERWSQKDPAAIFSRLPGVFTWDDHDIFDGWGSHGSDLQNSPYFQAVFKAASRAFEVFQLGGDDRPHCHPGSDNFLQSLTFAGRSARVDLLLLDLRSHRQADTVLDPMQWIQLKEHLAKAPAPGETNGHLLIVSSIPVVYLQFGLAESLAGVWPGTLDIEDDLRDQWESPHHKGERGRLIMNLLDSSKATVRKITILSGDVHVGSRGRITSTRLKHIPPNRSRSVIEQVTSSGITHPPPNWLEWHAIQLLGKESDQELEAGVTTELVPINADVRFLRARNWLSGRFDEEDAPAPVGSRLWIQWMTENGGVEPQVVVKSLGS